MINRISKIVSMTLVLIMVLTIVIGCKTVELEEKVAVETSEEAPVEAAEEEVEEEAEAVEPETVIITDNSGREVTIKLPVERILVLGCGIELNVVKALGAEEKVVGVPQWIKDSMSLFFPELSKLPTAGSWGNYDYEKIFELKPDVVFANYSQPAELEEMLEPEIPVVRLDAGPPLSYTENVKKLGLIFGKEDRADEYINWYQNHVNNIVDKVGGLPEEDKSRIFAFSSKEVELTPGASYKTFGGDNYWYMPTFEMAGGINIADSLPGENRVTVDSEWVIEQNPSIMIRLVSSSMSKSGHPIVGYNANDTSEVMAMREDIMNNDVFKHTDAVKGEEIYLIESDLIAFYWFISLQYMAKWFYPELFADLDPKAIHQEFLTEFQGLDYNLEKNGVFAYPES